MAKILIAGGAGFIGSHTALVLLEAGHQLVVFDNFSTSRPDSLRRVAVLAADGAGERLQVVEGDIRDQADLRRVFGGSGERFDAVIHLSLIHI